MSDPNRLTRMVGRAGFKGRQKRCKISAVFGKLTARCTPSINRLPPIWKTGLTREVFGLQAKNRSPASEQHAGAAGRIGGFGA